MLIPKEGFGWYASPLPSNYFVSRMDNRELSRTNASFQVGLEVLNSHERRALGTLTPPDTFYFGKKATPVATL